VINPIEGKFILEREMRQQELQGEFFEEEEFQTEEPEEVNETMEEAFNEAEGLIHDECANEEEVEEIEV